MTDTVAIFALLASMLTFVLSFTVIYYVLYVIGCWKVFTKANEAGWKSIIPFYNTYIAYKISWKTSMFWLMIVCILVSGGLNSINNSLISFVGNLIGIAVAVISIIQNIKLSKAFGHGVGFAIGLIFLNPIFMIILGLGGSSYIGPQE